MANQPLAFAELLAGSVLVISAITDRSIGETIRGVTEPAPGSSSILKASSSATAAGGGGGSSSTGGTGGGGQLPPTPQQAGASIHRKPSIHEILAFNRKLAAKGEHMTRSTLSKVANGELSIHTLEKQLKL